MIYIYSYETLCNLHRFLKTNKHFVNNLCNNFNTKGFSEDCGTSVIHQIIYHLNNILKSVTDSKVSQDFVTAQWLYNWSVLSFVVVMSCNNNDSYFIDHN